MLIEEKCPRCGYVILRHRNPVPTVDIIIEYQDQGLVLIERANPPPGWAFPGGFVDYGESLEAAAVREAREETGLTVTLLGQFHTYSDPQRDPRQHTITTVFVAQGHGDPQAADDARRLAVFAPDRLPPVLAFDHGLILSEYLKVRPQWLAQLKKPY
jgi:8-oxo-dGTP diphosphatase